MFLCTPPDSDFGSTSKKHCGWNACAVITSESGSMNNHNCMIHVPTCPSSPLDKNALAPEIPSAVVQRLLGLISHESRRSLRLTCKSWARTIDKTTPIVRPAANITPPEILIQIFFMLSPRDFDNARRTCSQWMRVSLNESLLECMLKRAGWWDSWQRDSRAEMLSDSLEESLAWKMSRRFATECVLSGRKTNVERPGFLTTCVVDFSNLSYERPERTAKSRRADVKDSRRATRGKSKFHVSNCGHYLLVTVDCRIYVYHLLTKKTGSRPQLNAEDERDLDLALVACVTCPFGVVTTTMDTSSSKLVIAALLRNRVGMVCDLTAPNDAGYENLKHAAPLRSPGAGGSSMRRGTPLMEVTAKHYFHDVCSTEDRPRSIAICSGRHCVAFGSGTNVELHWIDEKTSRECRQQFPMSQPSEILHFLPKQSESPAELRLISSLAGPATPSCHCHSASQGERHQPCPLRLLADVQCFTRWTPEQNSSLSLLRATHCHHYRAIPINDSMHILFIEPRTNQLCIGSDAPIGGSTSLTRALVCVPPPSNATHDTKEELAPTVFAAGSNLDWGLRIVAAYGDRIVLYSVPLDVFNVIRKEREKQGENVIGDSDLARDWFLENNQRSQKRRDSLVQTQNGDWEPLLSVSYRPTATMWPFKIYGKQIGRMPNVVELAIQTSSGGARVWAFGASGKTNIIDVDTFTSPARQASDIPYKLLSISTDGNIASTRLVDRVEPGLPPPGSSRKRKRDESCDDNFGGQYSCVHRHQHRTTAPDRYHSAPFDLAHTGLSSASKRRTSFAACIVDFKIPELSTREGRWVDNCF